MQLIVRISKTLSLGTKFQSRKIIQNNYISRVFQQYKYYRRELVPLAGTQCIVPRDSSITRGFFYTVTSRNALR